MAEKEEAVSNTAMDAEMRSISEERDAAVAEATAARKELDAIKQERDAVLRTQLVAAIGDRLPKEMVDGACLHDLGVMAKACDAVAGRSPAVPLLGGKGERSQSDRPRTVWG
jgi:hypothetical protein